MVVMNEEIDRKEWTLLNDAVRATCAKYGKEDSLGTKDFWISDDCRGGVSQKLVMTSPDSVRPKLISDLEDCISKNNLYGAQIMVILAFIAPEMGLLIVDAKGATEEWNLAALRERYGKNFYTDEGR